MRQAGKPDANEKVVAFPGRGRERSPLEQVYLEQQKRLIQYLCIRLGSRSEAEDVAQSAFLRLYNSRESLHNGNITALLFVTARNISTDVIRKRIRHAGQGEAHVPEQEIENISDESACVERTVLYKQYLKIVLKIIEELPTKCRASFIGYKINGLEYSEIAETLKVSESMVRKYVLKSTAYCVQRFDELEGWE